MLPRVVPATTARDGFCLDGSLPSYSIRRNASSAAYVLFLEGGGWCNGPTCGQLCSRHRKSSDTVRLRPSTSSSSLPDPGVGGGVGAIANFAAWSGDVWPTWMLVSVRSTQPTTRAGSTWIASVMSGIVMPPASSWLITGSSAADTASRPLSPTTTRACGATALGATALGDGARSEGELRRGEERQHSEKL